MRIAFQMDELSKLNFASDSTYKIMEEAYKRGFEIFFYSPKSLSWNYGILCAKLCKVLNINNSAGEKSIPLVYAESTIMTLDDFDFIFLRQDPPFDMAYITSTFLLEKLPSKVKVINNPISVRNSPEKLLVTNFAHLMPKTLISSDFDMIYNFLKQEHKCVIKPLYGNAGSDVFFLDIYDVNAKSIIEYFLHSFKEQVMVQEFMPNVKKGDKRIILIDGEPVGSLLRIPAENTIKSNLAAGGRGVHEDLTEQELLICDNLKPTLQKLGLFFTGIDVIDGKLTEINVTSPTGFVAIEALRGVNLAVNLWDSLLKKYSL